MDNIKSYIISSLLCHLDNVGFLENFIDNFTEQLNDAMTVGKMDKDTIDKIILEINNCMENIK